jgi:hypothetical protein
MKQKELIGIQFTYILSVKVGNRVGNYFGTNE